MYQYQSGGSWYVGISQKGSGGSWTHYSPGAYGTGSTQKLGLTFDTSNRAHIAWVNGGSIYYARHDGANSWTVKTYTLNPYVFVCGCDIHLIGASSDSVVIVTMSETVDYDEIVVATITNAFQVSPSVSWTGLGEGWWQSNRLAFFDSVLTDNGSAAGGYRWFPRIIFLQNPLVDPSYNFAYWVYVSPDDPTGTWELKTTWWGWIETRNGFIGPGLWDPNPTWMVPIFCWRTAPAAAGQYARLVDSGNVAVFLFRPYWYYYQYIGEGEHDETWVLFDGIYHFNGYGVISAGTRASYDAGHLLDPTQQFTVQTAVTSTTLPLVISSSNTSNHIDWTSAPAYSGIYYNEPEDPVQIGKTKIDYTNCYPVDIGWWTAHIGPDYKYDSYTLTDILSIFKKSTTINASENYNISGTFWEYMDMDRAFSECNDYYVSHHVYMDESGNLKYFAQPESTCCTPYVQGTGTATYLPGGHIVNRSAAISAGNAALFNQAVGCVKRSCPNISAGDRALFSPGTGTIRKSS